MKESICIGIGAVGSAIATLFGGWTDALVTLIIFMAIDYISGLAVALIFKRSTKTESGAASSAIGWKGLAKKGMTLAIVLIGHRLDVVFGIDYIQTAVIIGFLANELISITENAGLMGVPMPAIVKKAIDVLTSKADVDITKEDNNV